MTTGILAAAGASAALVLAAGWVVLYVAAGRRAEEGDAGRAGGANAALLVATLLAALVTCAAPIVPLVAGFEEVALAPPAEKSEVLERILAADRPFMWIALLSIPILVAGARAFLANRRRIRGAAPMPSGTT